MRDPQRRARVHVDFNDMDPDGMFLVLPQDADQLVALGSSVLLWDAEGNTAHGRVVDLRQRGRAVIEMLAGTWRRAPVENLPAPTIDEQLKVLLALYQARSVAHGNWFALRRATSSAMATGTAPSSGFAARPGAVPSSA